MRSWTMILLMTACSPAADDPPDTAAEHLPLCDEGVLAWVVGPEGRVVDGIGTCRVASASPTSPMVLRSTSDASFGAGCRGVGVRESLGVDRDGDGFLDADEVQATEFRCEEPLVVDGDLTLSSDADALLYTELVEVTGTLVLTGSLSDARFIPHLEVVGGDLRVEASEVLSRVEFPALQSVGGRVTAGTAPALTSLYLPVLAEAGGIEVDDLLRFRTLLAPALRRVGEGCEGSACGQVNLRRLISLSLLQLSSLREIGRDCRGAACGTLEIDQVAAPRIDLGSLEHVGPGCEGSGCGAISLRDLSVAMTALSFDALLTVGDGCIGDRCGGLLLDGFGARTTGMGSLVSVGLDCVGDLCGDLRVDDVRALTDLDLYELDEVGGSVSLVELDLLEDVDGLSSLTSAPRGVWVQQMNNLHDLQGLWGLSSAQQVVFWGNLRLCISEVDLLEASIPVPVRLIGDTGTLCAP